MRAVPNAAAINRAVPKAAQSMSLSQNQFPNHFAATTASADLQEQFEPTFVKLDKQVSKLSLHSSVLLSTVLLNLIGHRQSHCDRLQTAVAVTLYCHCNPCDASLTKTKGW